ncbi:DUF4249 domain-containing protein [Adhaeribacter aquaticus]|uniref:DUF4249 domain-containing protein n=1 Tax=Adhaeribacter aquaticus TaxID=299567 RepID=UPI00041BFB4D|nr:DUF4249 domain-containing protein [Adhaeribacter aquaticus]
MIIKRNKISRQQLFRTLLSVVLLVATACEKVLDIDLKEADPRIIIEANISDGPGPYSVLLSQSISFNQTNTFPTIDNAQVIISDNAGNSEILRQAGAGFYKTTNFKGLPGRNYFLKVTANGQTYEAASRMPQPIAINEISIEKSEFRSGYLFPQIKFQDPAGIKNYYRAIYTVNGQASADLFYLNDEFQDGKLVNFNFFDRDQELKSGDVVTIVLQTIDENVFRFLREEDLAGSSQSASPANPTGNFSNNALGYFSAHAETSASITVI